MSQILIVGAGAIAKEYVKITLELGYQPIVVGRGKEKIDALNEEYPNVEAISGGLDQWLTNHEPPNYAIVATPIEYLGAATKLLVEHGVKQLLIEKPLSFYQEEVEAIERKANDNGSNVYIAFNRRNYQSVIKAQELIQEDGGVQSFHFDFTEAIFRIKPENINNEVKQYWGLANSSHVIDTAFYLGGKPVNMECNQSGNAIDWHPAGSIFTGFGETEVQVPFTYHANWSCPGKWNIEVMTPKRKLLFSPMEKLHQQPYGTFQVELVDLDYSVDENFKPGFFNQVKEFISNEAGNRLPSILNYKTELANLNGIFNYQ
jgi:predicted dehydrogenase